MANIERGTELDGELLSRLPFTPHRDAAYGSDIKLMIKFTSASIILLNVSREQIYLKYLNIPASQDSPSLFSHRWADHQSTKEGEFLSEDF